MEDREAARVAPSDADLERAIASVPGVVSASVGRSSTGRSRLRIRLAAGEDAEKVSWAVAATLRERFAIALDPAAIRPRDVPASAHPLPADDPVRLVRPPAQPPAEPQDADAPSADGGQSSGMPMSPSEAEIAAAHERLTSSARDALAGFRSPATTGDRTDGVSSAPEPSAPVPEPSAPVPEPEQEPREPALEGHGTDRTDPSERDEPVSQRQRPHIRLAFPRPEPVDPTTPRASTSGEVGPEEVGAEAAGPEEAVGPEDAAGPEEVDAEEVDADEVDVEVVGPAETGPEEVGPPGTAEPVSPEEPDVPEVETIATDTATDTEPVPDTDPGAEPAAATEATHDLPDPVAPTRRSARHTHVGTPWPVDPSMRSRPRVPPRREPAVDDDTDRAHETSVSGQDGDGSGAGEVGLGEVGLDEVEAGEVEAGEVEAGEVEAGEVEAGEVDTDEPDRGQPDHGAPDSDDVGPDTVARGDAAGVDTASAPQGHGSAADPVRPPADDPGEAAQPLTGRVVSERAAIRHLDTERDARDVRVTATLEHGGRSATGVVTTAPTSHGQVRAVAEATIAALRELVGPDLIAGVDRISVQPADDPANAIVTIGLVTDRGEETLLGTSIVRGDPERAVMRATLDALNRRVAELFPEKPAAPDGSAA